MKKLILLTLTSLSLFGSTVTLSWTASNSPNIIGYNIYKTSTSGTNYTKITTSPVNALIFNDTINQTTSQQDFYYTITAVSNSTTNNESVKSNEVHAIIPATTVQPNPPTASCLITFPPTTSTTVVLGVSLTLNTITVLSYIPPTGTTCQ